MFSAMVWLIETSDPPFLEVRVEAGSEQGLIRFGAARICGPPFGPGRGSPHWVTGAKAPAEIGTYITE
jgi:hypothetical protein